MTVRSRLAAMGLSAFWAALTPDRDISSKKRALFRPESKRVWLDSKAKPYDSALPWAWTGALLRDSLVPWALTSRLPKAQLKPEVHARRLLGRAAQGESVLHELTLLWPLIERPEVEPALIDELAREALKHPNAAERGEITKRLRSLGPRSDAVWREQAADPSAELPLRLVALETLALNSQGREVVRALAQDRAERTLHEAALRRLAHFDPDRFVELVEGLLEDAGVYRDRWVKLLAELQPAHPRALILLEREEERRQAQLLEWAGNERTDLSIRIDAVRDLNPRGPGAAEVLDALAVHPDEALRRTSFTHYPLLPRELVLRRAQPALLQERDQFSQDILLRALRAHPSITSIPVIRTFLQGEVPSEHTRALAQQVLSVMD